MIKHANEKLIINVELLIATFLIAISHLITYSFSVFRWIGIMIVTMEILIKTKRYGFNKNSTNRFFLIFVLLLTCATFCNTTLLQKITSILYYITLLVWFTYGENLVIDKENILSMGIGGGLACIYGLFLTRDLISEQMNNIFITRKRIYGGFSHPNILGAMLATAILEVSIYIFFSTKKILNGLLIAYVFILSIMLYYTDSRTAIIMVMGGIITLFFKKIHKLSSSCRYLLYTILMIIIVYIIYTYIMPYVLNDKSYIGRIEGLFNIENYSMIQKIFGHGMTNSSESVGAQGKEIAWANIYFKLGIIGVFVYIYMIFVFLIKISKIYNFKKRQAAIASLAFMILSTFGDPYIINIANTASLFMWVVTGAIASKKFIV